MSLTHRGGGSPLSSLLCCVSETLLRTRRHLYLFLIAAVTNYPTRSISEQHTFVTLAFWRLGLKLMGRAEVHSFLEALGRINLFAIFPASHSLARGHLPSSKQQWLVESCSHLITLILLPSSHFLLSLTLLPPSFIYKDLCDYIGHIQIIQDNLPFSRSLI